MKSTNEIVLTSNNNRNTFSLSSDESAKLKKILIMICNDIFDYCKNHDITCSLGGGSVLGAVRHQGFIPWDDDIDLNMPRADYNRFILGFSKDFSYKYEIFSPVGNHKVTNTFTKVSLKNTIEKDVYTTDCDFTPGISIDIFPMEYAPEKYFLRRVKAFFSDVLSFTVVSIFIFQNRNKKMKKMYTQSLFLRLNYFFRCMIGFLLSFKNYAWWYRKYDSFVQGRKKSKYSTFPTGRKHYWGELHKTDVFLPTVKMKFEDKELDIPGKYDEYLSKLYGDYMKIPPEDKREVHFYTEIDFGEY